VLSKDVYATAFILANNVRRRLSIPRGLPSAGWPAAHPEADGSRLASAGDAGHVLVRTMAQRTYVARLVLCVPSGSAPSLGLRTRWLETDVNVGLLPRTDLAFIGTSQLFVLLYILFGSPPVVDSRTFFVDCASRSPAEAFAVAYTAGGETLSRQQCEALPVVAELPYMATPNASVLGGGALGTTIALRRLEVDTFYFRNLLTGGPMHTFLQLICCVWVAVQVRAAARNAATLPPHPHASRTHTHARRACAGVPRRFCQRGGTASLPRLHPMAAAAQG
jgi:hypothetical protein